MLPASRQHAGPLDTVARSSAWRVFSGEPVHRLADEVGVADVTGVLLDDVDQDTSQAWCLIPLAEASQLPEVAVGEHLVDRPG